MRSFPFYRLSPLSLLVYFTAEVAAVSSMKCLPAQGEFFAAAAGAELLFGSRRGMARALVAALPPAFVIFAVTLLTFGQGRPFFRFSVFRATFAGLKEASFLSLAFLNICLAGLFERRAQERKGAGRARSKAFSKSALIVEVSAGMVLSLASLASSLFGLLKSQGQKPSLFKKRGRREAKKLVYALLALSLFSPGERIERLEKLEKEAPGLPRRRASLKSWLLVAFSIGLSALCFLRPPFPLAAAPVLAPLPYLFEGGERAWAAAWR
ncbi:MAG: hypothetical protein IKS61_03715 [Aeriscardovia sp.]|nr:hypothetical protein [Aeriscardovia sp.]